MFILQKHHAASVITGSQFGAIKFLQELPLKVWESGVGGSRGGMAPSSP